MMELSRRAPRRKKRMRTRVGMMMRRFWRMEIDRGNRR